MRSPRRITAALVAALAFVTLTACTPSPNEPSLPTASQSNEVVAAFEALVDREWQLVSGTVDDDDVGPIPEVPVITLLVTQDPQGAFQLGGRTCNGWGRSLADFPDGDFFSTAMDCAPELMDVENAVATAISRTTSVVEDAGTLTLSGDGVELTWAEQEPLDRDALVDITWDMVGYDEPGPDAALEGATWTLKSDGTFTAEYDCFHLTGTWLELGSEVQITEAQTDGKCDESQGAIWLYQVFSGSFTTSFADGVLTTTSVWGETATHVPAS